MQSYTLKKDPFSSHSFIAFTINKHKPNRILDIGCNRGMIGKTLGQKWKNKLWAVDVDVNAIKKASRYYKEIYKVDIEKMNPRSEAKFDCLIFGDVLEHFIDPWSTLKKCVDQLLKRNGLVIISLPNIVNWHVRWHLAMGNFVYKQRGLMDITHLRFFTLKSAKLLIGNAGLSILENKVSPIPLPLIWKQTDVGKPFFWLHCLNYSITNLRPGLFGYQLLFVCKKK